MHPHVDNYINKKSDQKIFLFRFFLYVQVNLPVEDKNVFGNSYYTSKFMEKTNASYNKKHSMNSILILILILIKPSNINFVLVFNKMSNENIVSVGSVF